MSEIIPSPNIWETPDVYEVENRGVDRAHVIEDAMRSVLDWSGLDVVDIGCGTGYHLPYFARDGPVGRRRRATPAAGFPCGTTRLGYAVRLGPRGGCGRDRGARRLVRRGARAVGVLLRAGLRAGPRRARPGHAARRRGVRRRQRRDAVDVRQWFRRALPSYDPRAVERFWERQGWQRERLDIRWDFDSREDFEAVVGIEFAPEHADLILAEHPDATGVDYAVNLWHRRF